MERLKVGAEFCGWDSMTKLCGAAKRTRDRLLMLTLFKTGGRISEVLDLPKSAFDFEVSETSIIVNSMTILKKYEHTETGTASVESKRTFPVLKGERLSGEWLELLKQQKHQIIFYGQHIRKPMTRNSALKIVKAAGEAVSMRVSAHWFRGQRASQLAAEYGFGVYELNQFFGWGSRNPRNMAERYASLGWRGLEKRMIQGSS